VRDEESRTKGNWVAGVWEMLAKGEAIERDEIEERRSWTWLDGRFWAGNGVQDVVRVSGCDGAEYGAAGVSAG
jgi:hypothetical protein